MVKTVDVLKAIQDRRSVREFTAEEVANDDMVKILNCAIMAPSAGNCQPWEFVVVKDKTQKELLARAAYGQSFIAEAPVVIVVCADVARSSSRYGRRGENLYCIQDTAAAVQNILLASRALGYATCWVGAFDENEAAKVIKAPRGVRPLAIVPVGKPAEKPTPPRRVPLERIVHENRF